MAKIEIVFKRNGSGDKGVIIDAIGFKGKACEKALERVTEALGSVESIEDKDDLFENEIEEDECLYH